MRSNAKLNEKTAKKELAEKVKGTLVLRINAKKPETDKIRIAAKIIRRGGTVAFPTETVYGLGADALNAEAVRKLFEAKKRPPDNPIIVHVAYKEDIHRLARDVPEAAEKLISKVWPGPLTLVLKRSGQVPDVTVVGLDTIAIRMPKHKVALALLRESETPIAAPSANLAGKPSPTTAQHVIEDLAGRIDAILDAGRTEIGVESTVINMTSSPPEILRPGGTPYGTLRGILRRVKLHPLAKAEAEVPIAQAVSPGMKHRHYAPEAEMIVVEGELKQIIGKIRELAESYVTRGKSVGILATDESLPSYETQIARSLGSRENLEEIARNLFRLLREFDNERVDVILAEGVSVQGLGLAVMNRLRKASNFRIIRV